MVYHDKLISDVVTNCFDEGLITKNDNLVIALSGGIDSMCLLDVFMKLQSEFDYSLSAIHINHGIRGIEATRDMHFVKNYCDKLGIKLYSKEIDAISYSKKRKISLEEAARILRYDEFRKLYDALSKKNRTYILVAHHEQDQVETILHNLIRGTGIKGITGMKIVNGYILRPFLYSKKSDIEKYAKDYTLPYVVDSTNNDITYTRNYIRNEIIPRLISINENACGHIIDFSKSLNEIDSYIDAVSEYSYNYVCKDEDKDIIVLDLYKYQELSQLIKSYVIKIVIRKLVKTIKDIGKVHIESIIELTDKVKGGHIDLPYNITCDKKKDKIIFTKNINNISMKRRKNK